MYGPKTDVWAFGVMVYELYHGHTPFSYCQTEQDLRTSVVMPLQWHQLKAELPHDVKELILSCMEVREDKRPTIQQLASKTFLINALQNRDMQTSSELRFRSPLKVNGRLMEFDDNKRGGSKMKVRSSFSTQEESLAQRNLAKNISPNKSFFSNGTNMNGSIQINNRSGMESQPQSNSSFINQTIISIQAPTQPKRSSTTDRQSSTFHSLRSPLDQSLNNTQPVQTSIICNRSCLVSTQISFKESVSLLHYCRLIFKYLQCFKEFNSLKEQS
jgi:serine/threonine protein kinase